jgi:membrane-associated phospholipid phosphatase
VVVRSTLLAAVLCLVARAAVASAPEPHVALDPGPRAETAVDVAATAALGLAWWAVYEQHSNWVSPSCPCDRGDVASYDRGAVSVQRPRYEPWSNAALGTAVLGSIGLLALTSPDGSTWANDALLLAENVMLTGLLTQTVKTAVGRPYPYLYAPNSDPALRDDGINYASFWSGHTAVAMAGAVSFAYLFAERHPHSRWRWAAWALAPAIALAAGVLQVAAANHYPSDVAVGALAGATTSLLNLRLHTW